MLFFIREIRRAISLLQGWWHCKGQIIATRRERHLLDIIGENCVLGQHGRVWFLVGTLGGDTATRTCAIPEGTALFFPVINSVNIDTPILILSLHREVAYQRG